MTRVTNLGLKRTYLQAGFDQTPREDMTTEPDNTDKTITTVAGRTEAPNIIESHVSVGAEGEPPKKKKRIRRKKPKSGTEIAAAKEGDGDAAVVENDQAQRNGEGKAASAPSNKALKKKKWKEKEKEKKQRRLLSSEARRQKRTQERFAETTCFACREKGHAAKDCPNVKTVGGVEGAEMKSGGRGVVGICYRCGSSRHTLSKCRKAIDESNPLPFASCFVCSKKGHLASSCPQNAEKGIYPNGGCCKLCGDKTHLARDCALRKQDNVDTLAVIGAGDQLGADEDDFHTFRRRKHEVEKSLAREETKQKLFQTKTSAHSGVSKAFGTTPKAAKKVVNF